MAFSARGTVHRPTVTGTRGMVASAHPLATLAGVRILLEGGNAFDAVVAVAAALNVVEPYMSGMAGVGYALLYPVEEAEVRVLDYCGRTPYDATIEGFDSDEQQQGGSRSCLVPGACGGWLALLERFGSMTVEDVFTPAIELAENGFALTVKNANFMGGSADRMLPTGANVILSRGKSPLPGEILVQKDLANSFRRVAEGGSEAFYRGDLAREMSSYVQSEGGFLSERDLEDFQVDWVDPVSTSYHDFEVYCPPPPSAGFQILETLNMLESYSLMEMGHGTEETLHLFIEATKLANVDRVEYAAAKNPPIEGLLSKAYAAKRKDLISDRAGINRGEYYLPTKAPGEILPGTSSDWINECTTHFDVVDGQGNAVAITQSLGSGFGSGMIMGNTGMFLNNFIKWGDRVPGSPNCIEPHKKLDMCLSPCQVFRNGRLVSALGTPGSWGIQQTTCQFLTNYLDYGMNIQAAIEAPRFRFTHPGREVAIEARVSGSVREGLAGRGHQIGVLPDYSTVVGGAQGIVVDSESGAFMGGADPRRDGYALGI